MTDEYTDVVDVLERVAPYGPEPHGWAARARRRSNRRRGAVGVISLVAVGLIAAPLVSPVVDFLAPGIPAGPAERPADDPAEAPWTASVGCLMTSSIPATTAAPGDIVVGEYCWDPGLLWMQRSGRLSSDDLRVVVAALDPSVAVPGEASDLCAGTTCAEPAVGQFWLEAADRGGILVVEKADGRLVWHDSAGAVWSFPGRAGGDSQLRAALDGVVANNQMAYLDGGKACWVSGGITWSSQPLDIAVSGYLCDPTGTTSADVERAIPSDVVALIASSAQRSLEPATVVCPYGPTCDSAVRNSLGWRPTGWSLILKDAGGNAFYLIQRVDGAFAHQGYDGREWLWTPTGEAADALRALGMAHIPG